LVHQGGSEQGDATQLSFCKNFYLNAQTYDHASKRGKRHVHIKLEEAEADYHEMMQVDSTADQIFHRTWAWETVNLALNALRQSIKGKNKALKLRLLDRLNDDEKTTTAEIAAEFGVTDSKVRTALMRLREDLEFYILAETGRSIASKDPADIKAELKILRSKL
jgi:DNA-directed RNA polymerase specialized sigma24 family protein